MKKYFKVYRSFSDFVSIDESELEKAMHAFLENIPVVLKQGAVSRIESIMPDYHRPMKWNYAHELTEEDYQELKRYGVMKAYEGVIGEVKERVQHLIDSKQEHLIGQKMIGGK